MDLVIPTGVKTVRATVVSIDRNFFQLLHDPDWRALCRRAQCALMSIAFGRDDNAPASVQHIRDARLGGDSALLRALRLAANGTGHREVARAGVVLIGSSAAGNFGPTFAGAHPNRTIGYIRYHSNLRGIAVDTATLSQVPSLNIAGERDEIAGTEDTRLLWSVIRGKGGPSGFAIHSGRPHKSYDAIAAASNPIRAWTEAVIRQRASGSQTGRLSPVPYSSGWLVSGTTREIAPVAEFRGDPATASWLPDARSAFELRQLSGTCASVTLAEASLRLGDGAALDGNDEEVCHFVRARPEHHLWLSVTTFASDSDAAAWLPRAVPGASLPAAGRLARFVADPARKCSTAGATRSAFVFVVSLCGDGFAVADDSSRLTPILRRFAGQP